MTVDVDHTIRRAEHVFVFTGGPGSGKTSLIDALAEDGFATIPEAGRAIIQDQVAMGGHALPWDDRAGFAELMLACEMRSYLEAQALSGAVLCDRGIPDVLGYLTLCGLPVPAYVATAAAQYRYNSTVFLAPFWPAIFVQDAERKQDAAEAEATAVTMANVYASLGYRVVALPKVSIAERVDFVRRVIVS